MTFLTLPTTVPNNFHHDWMHTWHIGQSQRWERWKRPGIHSRPPALVGVLLKVELFAYSSHMDTRVYPGGSQKVIGCWKPLFDPRHIWQEFRLGWFASKVTHWITEFRTGFCLALLSQLFLFTANFFSQPIKVRLGSLFTPTCNPMSRCNRAKHCICLWTL